MNHIQSPLTCERTSVKYNRISTQKFSVIFSACKSTRVDNRAQHLERKTERKQPKTQDDRKQNVASTLSSRGDKLMCVKRTEKRKCRMRKDDKEATNRTKQKMKRREMLFPRLPCLVTPSFPVFSYVELRREKGKLRKVPLWKHEALASA